MQAQVEANDLAGAVKTIKGAKSILVKAQSDLDSTPEWEPGNATKAALVDALADWQSAYNKLQSGLENLDSAILQDAVTEVRTGADKLALATENLTRLRQQFGLSCS